MLPMALSRPVPARADPQAGPCPRVVAIGGGTGLPNVLLGLRPAIFGDGRQAARERLVALVATSDEGGSPGRLRA